MAEARGVYTDRIFRAFPQRGEGKKACANTRKTERDLRNFANTVSTGVKKATSKFKQFFQSKTGPSIRNIPKEVPTLQYGTSNRQKRAIIKKPPFVVPGVIRHNDLHLIQAVPEMKSNGLLSKKISYKPAAKATSISEAQSVIRPPGLKISSKVKTAACLEIAPATQGFVVPPGVKSFNGKCLPLTSRRKGISQALHNDVSASCQQGEVAVFTPRIKENPWITVNREFSAQKQFSSLSRSGSGSPTLPVTYFNEEFSDEDNSLNHSDIDNDLAKDSLDNKQAYELETPSRKESQENVSNSEESLNHSHENDQIHPITNQENIYSRDGYTIVVKPNGDSLITQEQQIHTNNLIVAQQLREQMSLKKFNLDELCCVWSNFLEEDGKIPSEETGNVLTVIRQTEQLQRERFNQYASLIDQFEHNSGEKIITTSDLEGFWEMVLLQVADLEKKFSKLDHMQKRGWLEQEVYQNDKEVKPKKILGRKKSLVDKDSTEAKSGIRSHIAALRKRMKDSTSSSVESLPDKEKLPISNEDIPNGGVGVLYSSSSDIINERSDIPRPEFSRPLLAQTLPHAQSPMQFEKPRTPKCLKVIQKMRKKHKSADFMGFFSPIKTISTSQRSYSTDSILSSPVSQTMPMLQKRNEVVESCKFLKIQFFSPTATEYSNQEQNGEQTIATQNPLKEENNNDPSESLPAGFTLTSYE